MQICRRSLLAITWCVALAVCGVAQEHSQHPWDYGDVRGPSHWGDLKPEFAVCKTGHRQSPIDIRAPQKADLPPIRFDYKTSPLQIEKGSLSPSGWLRPISTSAMQPYFQIKSETLKNRFPVERVKLRPSRVRREASMVE